jgi:hypothetical protein
LRRYGFRIGTLLASTLVVLTAASIIPSAAFAATQNAAGHANSPVVTPAASGGGCSDDIIENTCISWSSGLRPAFYLNSTANWPGGGTPVSADVYVVTDTSMGTVVVQLGVPLTHLGVYGPWLVQPPAGSHGQAATRVTFHKSNGRTTNAQSPSEFW